MSKSTIAFLNILLLNVSSYAIAEPNSSKPSKEIVSPTTEWEIDASHSEISFKVRHMMVSNTRGKFNKFSGKLTFDEKKIENSKVNVDIDAASIDTSDAKRDEHLRSADFFDTSKFPKLLFESTKISAAGKNKYKVVGNLTLHGVTKPVTLEVTNFSPAVKDFMGNFRRGLTATGKINRKDFGLTWNKVLETGGIAVGEQVDIQLEIEFTKAESKTNS